MNHRDNIINISFCARSSSLRGRGGGLTDQNQPAGLEQPLVVPVRVDVLQHAAHPVVLAQPQGGVHHEAGHQAERLVAHGKAVGVGHVGGVVHVDAHFFYRRRVHLSVQDLRVGKLP